MIETSIKIKFINGIEIKCTLEELKELKNYLNDLFPELSYVPNYPTCPKEPYVTWNKLACSNSN